MYEVALILGRGVYELQDMPASERIHWIALLRIKEKERANTNR